MKHPQEDPSGFGRNGSRFPGLDRITPRINGPSGRTLVISLLSQGFTLITGVVAARALGVEGRGDLALLWVSPLALVLIGGLGLPQATAYFIASTGGKQGPWPVVKTAIRVAVPLAVFLGAAYLIGAMALTNEGTDLRTAALISTLLVPLLLFQMLGVMTLQGMQDFDLFNLTRVFPVALYAGGAVFVFLIDRATLVTLTAISVLGFALAGGFTWFRIRNLSREMGDVKRIPAGKLLSFGFRGVLGDVNPVEDTRLDQLIVGFLINPRSLGLYVSAASFINLPRFITQALGAVAFPRIAAAADPRVRWRLVKRAVTIAAVAVSLTVGLMELILPKLISLLFGEEFLDAVPIGRILLVGAGLLAMKRLLTDVARGLGRPGHGSLAELINLSGFLGTLAVVSILGDLSAQTIALSVLIGAGASFLYLASTVAWFRRSVASPDR